jgi:hypothetical protein
MRHIKVLLLFFAGVASLTGCLKKNDANIDPYNLSSPVYTLEYVQPGGTTINSGLQYFGNGALTYPASHISDTASFTVRLTGTSYPDHDITVTIGPDTKALLDNFKADSITYEAMPDSLYKFINTTATIKKGTGVAYFQVVFFPSKINGTKNYMLAPTVTSPTDHQASANFGHIYFHTIGNPLAGGYTWDYVRIPFNDSTKTPDTHTTKPAVLAPSSPTVVTAPTGYYTAPSYIITFKNTAGVLSNFSAVISPQGLSDFAAGGISWVINPTISVSPDYKTIRIYYLVFNGTAYRYVFDTFVKK